MSRDATLDDVSVLLRAAGCVFAEEEARLLVDAAAGQDDAGAALTTLVERRVSGEPLEHVLGWVELAGRRWSVGPGVFVPRRRTELMVHAALDLARESRARRGEEVVVDLCCGCGAVGGAVAAGLGDRRVVLHASDVDAAAVRHARLNLEPLGGVVHLGDLFEPLPHALRGSVDILLCNAPYVPTAAISTMPPEARDHEPTVALDGGADGLDVLRRVVATAPQWLTAGGALLFEVGEGQVDAATALAAAVELVPRVVRDDDVGGTVVVATRAAYGSALT